MRRLGGFVAEAGKVSPSHVVDKDEDDVGLFPETGNGQKKQGKNSFLNRFHDAENDDLSKLDQAVKKLLFYNFVCFYVNLLFFIIPNPHGKMKVESFFSLSLIGLIAMLPSLSAKDHEGDEWAGFGAKLKQAVKEGKLSEEDAKAKWMAAVRKKKEAHPKKGVHDGHKLRMMEAIKRAVAEGKLSEREAKAKWMAIHGERRDDHHDRGRRHDDHDGHRNKYDDRHDGDRHRDRHEDHYEDHDDHHDGEHHDDEYDEHGQDELEEMHLDIERMHLEIELRKLHFEMERIEFDQDRERMKWDMDRMRMDHERQRMQREMEQRSHDSRPPHGMNQGGPPRGPVPHGVRPGGSRKGPLQMGNRGGPSHGSRSSHEVKRRGGRSQHAEPSHEGKSKGWGKKN